MHTVVETPQYLRDAKRIGLSARERQSIVECLARNPQKGDVIQGTGGARKIRFAAGGKGTSGGRRVITFYSGAELPVFLLGIFSKNEKIDLTAGERNALKGLLSQLAEAYERKGLSYVESRRKTD